MNPAIDSCLLNSDLFYPHQMGGRAPPEPTESEGDNSAEPIVDKASYDYLLSMPIWSLTLERVQALKDEADKQTKEVQRLKATAPEELWIEDLDAFLVVCTYPPCQHNLRSHPHFLVSSAIPVCLTLLCTS